MPVGLHRDPAIVHLVQTPHDAAGMATRAQCSIHVTPAFHRLQRVYNLFVKYRLMRRTIHKVVTTFIVNG